MPTPKVAVKRREGASLAILAIGGIAYFILCGPAITQRGYPPLEPIWWAMTFTWIFPLFISCWFDSWFLRPPSFSLLGAFYFFTVLCITIGFPFAFDNFVTSSKRSWARQKAELDWKEGAAYRYGEPEEVIVGDARVEYEIDRQTGLRMRRQFVSDVYAEAYNRRVSELLKNSTLPDRRIKDCPTPQQLFALLDSNELQEVTTFPQDVTPNIVVFRKGTINRWGSTSSSGSDGLSIATPAGLFGIGDGVQRVFTGSIPGCQDLVVIRNGTTWVGIFEKDGSQFASVSRFP